MSDQVERLRGGRAIEARGELTMDEDKAREKLRMFRLPDPHFYVLQFVRAASVLGATQIDFELPAAGMVCSFERCLPPDAFEDFWGVAFHERVTPADVAMHAVALGVGSAQALRPRWVRITSGGRQLTITADEEKLEAVPEIEGTRIEVREKFRFGHILDFFTEHAEETALRRHCEWAVLDVHVDGASIRLQEGEHPTTFSDAEEDGSVALLDFVDSSEFLFFRDDVLVRRQHVRTHHRPARGILNSRVLATDLSGLDLAGPSELDLSLHEKLYNAYHASLLEWVTQNPREDDQLEVGSAVFAHVRLLEDVNFNVPPATRALVDHLLDAAIFEHANHLERPRIGASDAAARDGRIGYSQQLILGAALDGYPAVLLADDEARRGFLVALSLTEHRAIDVTAALKEAVVAQRNRDVWAAQPLHLPVDWPCRRNVAVGNAVGRVFVPLTEGAACVDEAEVGGRIFVNGRLLRRVRAVVPLGVEIDGDFAVDATFSDIERGAEVVELILALTRELPDLTRTLARRAIAEGLALADEPRVLDQLIARALRGELSTVLFVSLGFTFDEASRHAKRMGNSDPLLSPMFGDLPPADWLEVLGELADVPSYECADDQWRTLRELIEMPQTLLVTKRRSGDRSVVARARTALHLEELPAVVFVSREPATILHRLREGAPHGVIDGNEEIERRAHARQYMERDPYTPIARHKGLRAATRRVAVEDRSIVLTLELVGDTSVCEAEFIYRDRLLGTRSWPMPSGGFRLTVVGDALTPTSTWEDVSDDGVLRLVHEHVLAMAADLLDEWRRSVMSGAPLALQHRELFGVATARHAMRHPEDEVLPALVWHEQGWQRRWVSLKDVDDLIEHVAGLISVTALPAPSPASTVGALVLELPRRRVDLGMMFPGARILDFDEPNEPRAERAFYERPTARPALGAALSILTTTIDGVSVEVGLLPGNRDSAGSNTIHAMWSWRELEQITVPVPFGTFRTIASGAEIGPDPSFRFVAHGRTALLEAAATGAAALLARACRIVEGGDAEREAHWHGLRRELWRCLGRCRELQPAPPFDLGMQLETAALFETTSGRRVSFRDLDELAVEGVIGYAARGFGRRTLRVRPDEVEALQSALAPDFELMPAGDVAEVIGDDPVPDRGWSSDPLLDTVATILVRARHGRRDLFDDGLAQSLRWTPGQSALCVVTNSGVELSAEHPLVRRCAEDPQALWFLVSAVYTSVNEYYESITDPDELELQPRLLSLSRTMRKQF